MRSKHLLRLAAVGLLATVCQSCHQKKIAEERQLLNDSVTYYSRQIQNIVGLIQQTDHTTEATQKNLMHDIDSIDKEMKAMIRRFGERNKDNELGREILENFQDE